MHADHLEIKDTSQGVDPALYRLQQTTLGGHVLLGGHGNAVDKSRRAGFNGISLITARMH